MTYPKAIKHDYPTTSEFSWMMGRGRSDPFWTSLDRGSLSATTVRCHPDPRCTGCSIAAFVVGTAKHYRWRGRNSVCCRARGDPLSQCSAVAGLRPCRCIAATGLAIWWRTASNPTCSLSTSYSSRLFFESTDAVASVVWASIRRSWSYLSDL